jgi:GTP-dependent phosphoenolpyruvate carboxykinase
MTTTNPHLQIRIQAKRQAIQSAVNCIRQFGDSMPEEMLREFNDELQVKRIALRKLEAKAR